MEQLRRLDESAQKPGTIASIALGTVSSLVMGVGMCCVLVWTHLFALGVVVGVIGMIGMGLAYTLFMRMAKKQREKIAPVIMRLSDELMTQK